MKKLSLALLSLFLLLSFSSANAQGVERTSVKFHHWKVGLNLSVSNTPQFWNEKVLGTTQEHFWNRIKDVSVGFSLSRNLGLHWEVRTGLEYSQKATTYSTDCPLCLVIPTPEMAVTTRRGFVDIPLSFRYYTKENQRGFFAEAGVRASINSIGTVRDIDGNIVSDSHNMIKGYAAVGHRFVLAHRLSLDISAAYEHSFMQIPNNFGIFSNSLGGFRLQTGLSFSF